MCIRNSIGIQVVSLPGRASHWVRAGSLRAQIGAVLLGMFCGALLLPVRAQTSDAIRVSSAPGLPSNQARSEKYSVSGTVINAVTGEPIRKALVQVYGVQQRTSFTDGDGRFQFDGMPAGQISLNAQKPGYFSEQEMRRQGQLPFAVGPNSDSVVLKLTPEGVISGKVTTPTGTPLENVPLSLMYLNVREGRRHYDSKGTAVTDEDGHYRFANLLPGTYYLAAEPFVPPLESVFELPPEPKTGYPGVYYPGVPDLASSSPISLSAGQQAEASFSLNEVPSYNISGTISGYMPNQGVNLQLCDQSGNPVSFSYEFSPENGRFDFHGVPSGVYVLKAFSQSAPNQPVRTEARLNVASNVFNLHLALVPAIAIPISVRTESVAQSAPGAKRYPAPPFQVPPIAVRLMATQPGLSDSYATLEGPAGAQTLILRNVEPGRYSVELMPQGIWYVQSAESGQTNLLTDELTVTAGAPVPPIEIVLRDDVATLGVIVKPSSGLDVPATIVVVPAQGSNVTPRTGQYFPSKDANGGRSESQISSLAPGEYFVLAFDHIDSVEYSNPDVLKDYLPQAAHATLSANQNARVTVDLIRTGEAAP
ncbi:MAG TPA: carboxypeptidase-like regulatory domain-containing protein [Terriglobales bacterium]